MARDRNQLLRLHRRNPHCYWCGTLTVLSPKQEERQAPNSATRDHLRSRFHKGRQEPNIASERRIVLACFKCNQERSKMEQSIILSLEAYLSVLDHRKTINMEQVVGCLHRVEDHLKREGENEILEIVLRRERINGENGPATELADVTDECYIAISNYLTKYKNRHNRKVKNHESA